MNFDIGGPSVHNSSSSSSDDDNPLGLSNEEYQATLQILSINSMMIEYYQNQRRNCSTQHGGSILGHIVVRRDR